jgi:DNA-binding FadR family transcriptional regulator
MENHSSYQLCKKIFTGHKQGAKLLNENLLAKKYGVSRATLREALKILQSKGVIKSKQKTGTVLEEYKNLNFFDKDILSWSKGSKYADNMRKYFIQTRLMFEPEIAYLCAKNIDLKNKKELDSIYEALEMSIIKKDVEKLILADLAFHNKIILNCGNPILYKLSEFINHMLRLNFTDNNNKLKRIFIGWEDKYLKQHKDLKNFIIKGNPLKAKNKMISIISANKI